MSTTSNRVRSRQLSFRLTEKELSRWNKKQKASGLNKTEFLLKILDKSDVKIYQFNNTIKAIFHELQMTGNNLNQIAYLANCGYFHESADKIPAFQKRYYSVMESLQALCCGGWRMAFGNVNVKFSPCKAVGKYGENIR